MQGSPALRRLLATTTVAATVAALSLASVAIAPAAVADTAPASPSLPTTVTTDPLPTVQINGVVWNQQIVGGTVYVAGNFTSARPAGSPAGTGEVPRTHLLAYDLATGVLVPGFAPVLNGQVKDLAVSPDQRTLYVGGQFTTVDGANRYRAAAFDVATGTLVAGFRPTINATVNAISATSTTVFLGGNFTTVNGQTRTNAAAVTADTGATTPFAVSLVDGTVNALTVAPDGASVVIGGSFTSANGSTNPGYGLARLDASTGASLPLPVNTQVRDAGTESAIVSLETDGQNFYGTGYHYGRAGNVEGTFSADWATGSLTWVEDCHGDTYSAFPIGDVIYQASHKHYCGNSGGFPQTEPWTFHRGTAVSRAGTGVNAPDIYGYPDHAGQASPTLLHWFPDINAGTFTGLSQGPWTVSGNASYVLMGGEFTTVGGVPQQGLVRFATSAIAPDSQGPQLVDAAFPLVATPDGTGSVRLTWRTNQDPDNQTLTYKLYRSTQTSAPIYETTVTAPFWQPQGMSFSDSGLPAGSSQRYRLAAVDAFGNQALSAWVTVDLTATGTPSAYAQEVLDDRPLMYWRLGEASGSAVLDRTGFEPATASSGVTRGAADALTNDADTATTFSGTTSGYAADPVGTNAPDTFTLESWVRTTSTRGGKIVGFGNRSTGTSTIADRHLYIDNQGRLHFGVQGAAIQDLATGTGFNNGVWHHVVGTYEAGTMTLYVDGVQRAQRTDVAYERSYWGFWRIGGDRLNGWPNRPTSDYLGGTLDEVAVYPYALSGAAVAEHHRVGTTGAAANREPVAAFVATPTGLTVQVDAAGSTDPDGTIASYAWQFGEGGATGSGVSASHTYATAGQHTITLTVTDNQGATNVTTRQVTVTAPPPPGTALGEDAFARSVVNGWGTAQVGGAWTSTGVPGRFSVDGSRGRHTLAAGATADSSLTAGTATSTDLRVLVSADKVPTGTGAWVHVQGRRVSATDYYGARLRLQPDGTVQLHTTRANGTTLTGGTVTGLTFSAGDQLGVRVQVEGTAPTTVRARVWKVGTPEPTTWFTVTTDSTASLQVPGAVGLVSFVTSSATNGPVTVSFDDLVAGPIVVNQAPSASFSATPSDLSVGVDASGSTDPDGTISSYAWTFGDGGTATGATATHPYTQAGTYPVTLTVTDDDGATATTSRSVTVTAPPPNQAPVSAFQATTSHLSVSVDGSGSTDADGTLTGFAWDFGDGTTASTATASHTYAVPGDYTVSLTVTDDDGATGTSTAVVTATAPPGPPPPFVQDAFARSVTNGWGASDVGGAWTSTGSAGRFSVDGAVGRHTLAAGATADSALSGVSSSSTEVRVVLSADKVPNGTGAWVHVQGRRISAVNYLGARIRLQPTGAVELHATSGNGTAQAGGGVVTGLSFAAGDQLNVRLQVFGTSATATTVRAKVWKVGTPEPDAWRVAFSDTTASLQAPGGVGVVSYLTAGATNGPVVIGFDDLSAGPVP